MDFGIRGRVALVTGAGRGIGVGIALRLAEEGVKVAVNDLIGERAEKTVKLIKDAGYEAVAAVADVTDYDAVKAMVKQVTDKLGPVDILVNNAGVLPREPGEGSLPYKTVGYGPLFVDTDRDFWERRLNVIIYGTMQCTRCVIEGMMERRWGRIINTVSGAMFGMEGATAYSFGKAGLVGFSRSLAEEVGPYCITVNCVSPAIVTESNKEFYEWSRERLFAKRPMARGLNRFAEANDVGDAVAFLASERAWFTTGQIVTVTGGLM